MSRKTLTALILSALLMQGAVGQDEEGIPELDVVESDDLNQLLNDAEKPSVETASEAAPAAETPPVATEETLSAPATTETADSAEIMEPLPADASSENLARSLKRFAILTDPSRYLIHQSITLLQLSVIIAFHLTQLAPLIPQSQERKIIQF